MTVQLGFNSPAAGARVGQNFTVTGFAFDDGLPMGGDPPNGQIAIALVTVTIGAGARKQATRSGTGWTVAGSLPAGTRAGDLVTVTATCEGVVSFDDGSGEGHDFSVDATLRVRVDEPAVTAPDTAGDADSVTVSPTAVAPPSLTIDPFDANVAGAPLPVEFVLTGGTNGTQVGVRNVYYTVMGGVPESVVNTGPGGDWTTWRAQILLPTTGTFTVTVTATDLLGRTASATVSVNVLTPVTVTLDPFDEDVAVTSLPVQLALTGTTFGAMSGITSVRYAVTNGPSGPAVNTGRGGDWSTWRAQIPLPTTGTFTITITATDSLGHTGTASGSVNLHL